MMTMRKDENDDKPQVSLWGGDAVFNNLDLRLEVELEVFTTKNVANNVVVQYLDDV